jgi:hypothetical protein
MNQTPSPIQSILHHLAEQAIPSAEIDLWPALQARLGTSKLTKSRGAFKMNTKFRFAVVALSILLLVVGFLVATPQGRALAQQVLGYFKTTKEKYPPRSTPAPTYTPEPTYVISGGAVTVQATPAVDPNQCGPTVSPVSSTFPCQLINAEAEAGFEIKTFPADRVQLKFDLLVVLPDRRIVSIGFSGVDTNPDSAMDIAIIYAIAQGVGDFPADDYWSPVVPENTVQQVQVGIYPAEYYFVDYTSMVIAELRWMESGRWFDIYYQGVSEEGIQGKIIGLAANLVTASQGVEKLAGADTPTVAQRAGFDLMEPTTLPKGFQLCSADYVGLESDLEQMLPQYVSIQYCLWEEGTSRGGAAPGVLQIIESPVAGRGQLRWVFDRLVDGHEAPTMSEDVQVNGVTGQYLANEMGQALIWTEGDLRLMIVFTWTSSYGGRLGKEDLITIAESMK